MQIVIDIDEEEYTNIKKALNSLIENGVERASMSKVCLAILDGTPLPKGHGRLISADELLEMSGNYKAELGRLKADPFVRHGIETVEGFVKDILPTIIEADKESEE